MKKIAPQLIIAIVTIFLVACNSTPNNVAARNNAPAVLKPISEQTINQQWMSVIHCNGYNYWFNTSLNSVGQDLTAKFSLNYGIDSERRPRLSVPVTEMTGIVEMRSGTFTLFRPKTKTAFTRIEGVFSQSEEIIAAKVSTAIRPLEACSNMIMVPGKDYQKLVNVFAQSNKAKALERQQHVPGKSIFNQPANRYNTRAINYCTSQTKQWVNTFFAELSKTRYGWHSEYYNQIMYNHDVFATIFNQPYFAKPSSFLNNISRQIAGTNYCSTPKEQLQKYRNSLIYLTKPLVKYNESIIINSVANSIYNGWLSAMVPAIKNDSYIKDVSKPVVFYDWIRTFLQNAEISSKMDTQQSTTQLLTAKARNISTGKATTLIDEKIASLELNITQLIELADFRYEHQQYFLKLSEIQRKVIEDKIRAKLNEVVIPVVIEDLSQKTSVDHYYEVKNWQKTYALMLDYLTPENVSAISDAAIKQQSTIAAPYIKSIASTLQNEIYPIKDKTQQLIRCRELVKSSTKKYDRLKSNTEFIQVIESTNNHCAKFLIAQKPAYKYRISKTKTLNELASLEKYYSGFIDFSSRLAADLNASLNYRREILTARHYSWLAANDKRKFQKSGIIDSLIERYFFTERGRFIYEYPAAVDTKPGAKVWSTLNKAKGFSLRTQYSQKSEVDSKCNVDRKEITKAALKRSRDSHPNYVLILKLSGSFYGAYTESRNVFGNKNVKADKIECKYQYNISLYLPSQKLSSKPLLELTNAITVESVTLSNGYLERMVAGEIDYLLDIFIPSKLSD
ncbi:hypothetical protein [Paraglaciecola sp. L3A3]|uniref:hypothetical protein n=1 Tax=Paraglaciecola sp. L3A3 TaxID=2686358 RepID=UPI00131C8BF2|nr:hypothetical protein [Paraglaciecola sp. L3A3]